MATFQPPTVDDLPRVLPDTRGPGRSLFRHYSNVRRGRSVLKNRDGTYTIVDTPTGDQIDAAAMAYIGGHIYEVDDTEAAALVAAGFTVDADVPVVPSGPGHPWTWDQIIGTWDDLGALTWDDL